MPVDLQVLARAVKQAQYRHHRAIDRRLVAVGSTLAQWDALRAIDRQPGASAHQLAVATFQTDQAFGTLTGRLMAQGLVERRPGHGRRIEHHLSESGALMLARAQAVVDDFTAKSFAGLDEVERATLLDLLHRIGRTDEVGFGGDGMLAMPAAAAQRLG